jgi:hypothetical protein
MGGRARPEDMTRMCQDALDGVGTQKEAAQEVLGQAA